MFSEYSFFSKAESLYSNVIICACAKNPYAIKCSLKIDKCNEKNIKK